MKAQKFTDASVKRFKYDTAGSRIQRIWDSAAPGLGVEAFPSGRKSWIFRYRIFGFQKFMTLGAVNDLALVEARAAVAAHQVKIDAGVDPKVSAELPEQSTTMAKAFESFTGREVFGDLALNTQVNFKSVYKTHLENKFADRPVNSIKRPELNKLINDLIAAGHAGAAQAVFANTKIFFKFIVNEYELDYSPTFQLAPQFPKSKKEKIVLTTKAEVRQAWFFDGLVQERGLVRMLLLTGCRRDELRNLRFDMIKKGVIRIPTTKNGSAHALPITPLMQTVLDEMESAFDSDFVFPSKISVNRPMSQTYIHNMLKANADFQSHALRRTVKTWLSKVGVDLEGRSAVCNHSAGAMDDLYNFDEKLKVKRKALNKYHKKLAKIIAPKLNVVQIIKSA